MDVRGNNVSHTIFASGDVVSSLSDFALPPVLGTILAVNFDTRKRFIWYGTEEVQIPMILNTMLFSLVLSFCT